MHTQAPGTTAVAGIIEKLRNRTARVTVLGQGYVGLVVAMRAIEAGFPVVGLEVDEQRLAALQAGESYVEDVPDSVLRCALANGYVAAGDVAALNGFDVAVITVPTPLHDGQPDLGAVRSATHMVGSALRSGCLVILESTTYPGTTEEVVRPILERESGLIAGHDFLLGYSPERIDPGNPTFTLETTPKIVSGIDGPSRQAVADFYGAFVETLVPVSRPAEAELAKLIENTFRHVNVALVNELAMFANDLDVDIWEALDAAASKPFGFMRFQPGPGVGGHCLPIDPTYLSWRVRHRLGKTFHFVELANEVNRAMPEYVARRVQALLNSAGLAVNGSHIVVLGLAYKPGTSDARESPSVPIVRRLRELGADVAVVDPHVARNADEPGVLVEATPETLRGCDLVLLLTDHPEFDYEMVVAHAPRVFDARGRLRDQISEHIQRL